MDKYHFRLVVSRFIYSLSFGHGFGGIRQSEISRSLGVRDATVSSWVNKNSCISAFMLFQLFYFFARQNRMKVGAVVLIFIEKFDEVLFFE